MPRVALLISSYRAYLTSYYKRFRDKQAYFNLHFRDSCDRLYFYSRSDPDHRENHMEIDFLITVNKKISPVEVKSGNYRSHASLDKFRKKFSRKIGTSYILYAKDVMEKDGILHLPHYMAMLL